MADYGSLAPQTASLPTEEGFTGYLARVAKNAYGSLFPTGTQVSLAPPLANYPSSEDAAYAMKYGFGSGDPRMDLSSGSARVLGNFDNAGGKRLPTFVPKSGEGSYLNELTGAVDGPGGAVMAQAPPRVIDTLQRAALAANRIPIAALGFDPTRMVGDTKVKNPTVGGAYAPSQDAIYYNMPDGDASSPVHESIHRGIAMLRKDPANEKVFRDLPAEEYVVRHLMATQAGDPEKGHGAKGDEQRNTAVSLFNGLNEPQYRRALEHLTRAAEESIAKRRPGGPR